MAFDTLQKSRLILKILTTVCVLTSEKRNKKLWHKLILHIPLTFTFTTLMCVKFVTSSDLNQASDVLYTALTEVALVAKLLNVWYYDALVKSLFNEWQENEMFKLHTLQECFMWQRTMKAFGLISFFYITCSLCVGGSAFIAVLFLDSYQLPFPYWTPFDWRCPSNYWYAYFYQVLAVPLTTVVNVSIDALMYYMMQHLALQFKLIATRLENLNNKENHTNAAITEKLVAIMKLHQKLKRIIWPYKKPLQLQMSTHNRKIILVYMQYLQKPVVIKAGNFFNVDLTTFTKTINNAYSFFALLLNMDVK